MEVINNIDKTLGENLKKKHRQKGQAFHCRLFFLYLCF